MGAQSVENVSAAQPAKKTQPAKPPPHSHSLDHDCSFSFFSIGCSECGAQSVKDVSAAQPANAPQKRPWQKLENAGRGACVRVLQRVGVCCSVLQCVRCNTRQHTATRIMENAGGGVCSVLSEKEVCVVCCRRRRCVRVCACACVCVRVCACVCMCV